jgi:DNA-binding transcriptional regulator YiaG
MSKKLVKIPSLCEHSSIGVRKACLLAIGFKLDNLIDTDDIVKLRDYKVALHFNEFDKAEPLKEELCSKYIKHTRSGASILAKMIGVSTQTVNNWLAGKILVPATMVKVLQNATAISPGELRPDLFCE